MRSLLQRVSEASVTVDGKVISKIDHGFLILLGIEAEDGQDDIKWLCQKISKLRVFSDDEGLMNRSIKDVGGAFIVVSQFTLHASTKKGNRPSFIKAARPEQAIPLYEAFVQRLREISELDVQTGKFGADMKVALVNDGPVTIWMDSKRKE